MPGNAPPHDHDRVLRCLRHGLAHSDGLPLRLDLLELSRPWLLVNCPRHNVLTAASTDFRAVAVASASASIVVEFRIVVPSSCWIVLL